MTRSVHLDGSLDVYMMTDSQTGKTIPNDPKPHRGIKSDRVVSRYEQNPPDFKDMANKFPDLKPFVTYNKSNKPTIDFKDPKAVRELTKCILKNDFGLEVDFSLNALCPTVPNRLNYVTWIKKFLFKDEGNSPLIGIDIGVGESCIYPLLIAKECPEWEVVGTEINLESFENARKNVEKNNSSLKDRVKLYHLKDPSKRLPIDEPDFPHPSGTEYGFCMCNPPFYESVDEMQVLKKRKLREPSAKTNAKDCELITSGGEYRFISDLIKESVAFKSRVRWYTSLVGKKVNLDLVKTKLREHNVPSIRTATFIQGRTTRWAIGWSFTVRTREFRLNVPAAKDEAEKWIENVMARLDITSVTSNCEEEKDNGSSEPGTLYMANSNLWSRSARRKKKALEGCSMAPSSTTTERAQINVDDAFLVFTVNIETNRDESTSNDKADTTTLALIPKSPEMNDKLESLTNHLIREIKAHFKA